MGKLVPLSNVEELGDFSTHIYKSGSCTRPKEDLDELSRMKKELIKEKNSLGISAADQKKTKELQKIIDVDMTEFGEDNAQQLQLELDVVLYRDNQYLGVNFLKTMPFGRGRYMIKKKQWNWDKKYKEEMRIHGNILNQIKNQLKQNELL